jgi:hypothetical protein
MTLSEARTAYIEYERLAIRFPRNAACQRMRQNAYAGWLQAVRTFRNGDCATQDEPEGIHTGAPSESCIQLVLSAYCLSAQAYLDSVA